MLKYFLFLLFLQQFFGYHSVSVLPRSYDRGGNGFDLFNNKFSKDFMAIQNEENLSGRFL